MKEKAYNSDYKNKNENDSKFKDSMLSIFQFTLISPS